MAGLYEPLWLREWTRLRSLISNW